LKGALENPRDGAPRHTGRALLGPALLLWVPVPVDLLPPLPVARKGQTPAGLLVAGEVASRVSAPVFGGEAVRRHRAYPYPSSMFGRDGS
jgi:hypothetical protein